MNQLPIYLKIVWGMCTMMLNIIKNQLFMGVNGIEGWSLVFGVLGCVYLEWNVGERNENL